LQPNPARSELWNRGAQIVNGVAHIGGCHTPKNLFFADKTDRAFQGDVVDGWFAPNLTGSNSDGLGSWGMADIIQYLRTGKNRFDSVAGSMQAVVSDSTSRLSDADLGAIATYLKALSPAPEPVRTQPSVHAMTAGENIFTQRCAFCHHDGSDSSSIDYPRLAGNTLPVLMPSILRFRSRPCASGVLGSAEPSISRARSRARTPATRRDGGCFWPR
jgi:mono/diheme cytochrome c family protein